MVQQIREKGIQMTIAQHLYIPETIIAVRNLRGHYYIMVSSSYYEYYGSDSYTFKEWTGKYIASTEWGDIRKELESDGRVHFLKNEPVEGITFDLPQTEYSSSCINNKFIIHDPRFNSYRELTVSAFMTMISDYKVSIKNNKLTGKYLWAFDKQLASPVLLNTDFINK